MTARPSTRTACVTFGVVRGTPLETALEQLPAQARYCSLSHAWHVHIGSTRSKRNKVSRIHQVDPNSASLRMDAIHEDTSTTWGSRLSDNDDMASKKTQRIWRLAQLFKRDNLARYFERINFHGIRLRFSLKWWFYLILQTLTT